MKQKKLRIAYMGTPWFSAEMLHMLLHKTKTPIECVCVLTQQDKPVGRKKIITPSPVKRMAQTAGIPVHDESQKNDTESFDRFACRVLTEYNIDLCILFAFGKIIGPKTLNTPTYGFWNVHPSILPLYRGAAPIAYPLLLGETTTGTTIIKMNNKLDQGAILAQQQEKIPHKSTHIDIERSLTTTSFQIIDTLLKELLTKQTIIHLEKEQEHSRATYTRMLTKNDGYVPFPLLLKGLQGEKIDYQDNLFIIREYFENNSTSTYNPESYPSLTHAGDTIYNMYRGLCNWPGIWTQTTINKQTRRLKLTDITCQNHILTIKKLQLEGRPETDFTTFQKAYHLF